MIRTPFRHAAPDAALPTINLAFLLLVFFLLLARIAPAPPLEVTLPDAGGTPGPTGPTRLWADADGRLAYDGLTGDAALVAAAGAGDVTLAADAALDGGMAARLLARLAAAGAGEVTLILDEPGGTR